ncbi:MAG: UPF0182 family protein [Myxococcota bacterium]
MAKPSEIAAARRRLGLLLAAGGVLLVLLLGLPGLAHLYTELLWFRSAGRSDVFTTILQTRVLLGVGVGVVLVGVLEANLRIAMRLTGELPSLYLRDPGGVARVNVGRIAPTVLRGVSLLIGVIAGVLASQEWPTWLRFRHRTDFGMTDPLFGQDVGFYVFSMPLHEGALTVGLWATVLSFMMATAAHVARGGLVHDGHTFHAHRRSRVHLTVLAALLFLFLAYDAWLDTRDLLFSNTGPVAGASYADVNARLPALRALIGTAIVASILIAASATRQRLVLAVAGVGLYLAVSLLGGRLYPALVQRFSVVPNEAKKEAAFIQHNIDATRAAYGLDDVEERDLTGSLELTLEDIEANRSTVDNIRLWDHKPLLDTFAQIQEIRTYYDFASVDNDRYVLDGMLRQTMLSPRELSTKNLPSRTWINERFTFTHGYGLTLGPVNKATEQGLPVLYVKDIPPVSSAEGIDVTRPGIYFGEMSNDHVFVNTENPEFDRPSGGKNIYSSYDGKSGVWLDSFAIRAAMAARVGSLQILLSDNITHESRVLLHREIRDRVRTLAPFLSYDRDPYMVVREDGRLAWIQDAYTTTRRYPYAEPAQPEINYIRNSVKVVIDAYDGTVDFYATEERDPILSTWRNAFPEMFRPMSELPADLGNHLRHPEDLFRIQTELFSTYHMGDPELVYNREDQWEIPSITRTEGKHRMEPYYTVMRLPGEDDPEFILMLPFTPKRKDNLAAWMVARSDEEHLGQLRVYRFPRDRLVYGPQQVMNRISQDADISRQISLWDQRGSSATLGTLLVIPIEKSLIYVSPLYLRSSGGNIPELKRVIVAYGNEIAMEPTLDRALAAVFRDASGPPTQDAAEREAAASEGDAREAEATEEPEAEATEEPEAEATEEPEAEATEEPEAEREGARLAERARDHFERAEEALQDGDWAGYGEHMERVRSLIQDLAEGSSRAP